MSAVKGLEKPSDRLLRLIEQPLAKGETLLARLDAAHAETGAPVHADLMRLLTHLSYPNDIARRVWSGYEVHRATLGRRLGRDVGVRVALFDYLLNVDRRLSNPKIIEFSDYEQTERSAVTDHLTGLFNRAHFDACLKKEINRCKRYGQAVSLVLLDVDRFKSVNDRCGHPAGDAVLRDVGRLLGQRVRDIDIAARYGGDEFGVILPETRRVSAFVVAERIRSEIERYFKRRRGAAGREVMVTVSGGIASFPDDADTFEILVQRADAALYRAKTGGRNLVSIFYHEKRRTNRIDVGSRDIKVLFNTGGLEDPTSGRLLNISEGGVLVETVRPLELGQNIQMRFAAGKDAGISLSGEVVRLELKGEARRRRVYGAGVRFRFGRGSPPQDLSRFIRQAATEA